VPDALVRRAKTTTLISTLLAYYDAYSSLIIPVPVYKTLDLLFDPLTYNGLNQKKKERRF